MLEGLPESVIFVNLAESATSVSVTCGQDSLYWVTERLGRRAVSLQTMFTSWLPGVFLLEVVNSRMWLLKEQQGDWSVPEAYSSGGL